MHGGKELLLYNVYGPNRDNQTFSGPGDQTSYYQLEGIISAGDLNTVHSPMEDRRLDNDRHPVSTPRVSDKVLPSILNITRLRDRWRDTHPEGRDYSGGILLPGPSILLTDRLHIFYQITYSGGY